VTATPRDGGWYADRRVLVIGGFGFIGINASRRLLSLAARITILTPSRGSHAADASELAARGASIVEGDLRDAATVGRVVAGQEVIFNLAGQSGAVRSMQDPLSDLDANCRANLVLLEALRRVSPTAKVVFPGSRLEYGHSDSLPVAEEDGLHPRCIHAVHKIAVEHYLDVYRHVYGTRSSVLRVTNPYGPGQPAGRTAYGIVNRMIHLALNDEPLVVFGDGRQRRDYIYVDDTVEALLAVGASPATDGRTYNVGGGVGLAFVDMAQAIVEAVGRGRVVFQPWPSLDERIETGDFVADISLIGRDVGWRPTTTFPDGLMRTIDACRAHLNV
jgi:UDP-glucose 4-epimerase